MGGELRVAEVKHAQSVYIQPKIARNREYSPHSPRPAEHVFLLSFIHLHALYEHSNHNSSYVGGGWV